MDPALRAQLEGLHRQLQKAGSVDAESRELLVTLLTDITRLLATPGHTASDRDTVKDRLERVAVDFEAEHPALGTAVRQLIDALAKAGI